MREYRVTKARFTLKPYRLSVVYVFTVPKDEPMHIAEIRRLAMDFLDTSLDVFKIASILSEPMECSVECSVDVDVWNNSVEPESYTTISKVIHPLPAEFESD